MKLLLLASEFPPRRGGIGTYAREMAEAAVALGHQVTVLAPDYGADQSGFDADLPFKVVRFKGRPHTMRQLPSKVLLLQRFARQHPDFDLVHACDWPFYLPLALSAYRGRSRCILTFHGTEVKFIQHPKRALALRLIGFWNGWAEYVANSRWTRDSLCKAIGLAPGSVRAIPLAVSAAWFEPVAPRHQTRASLGLDQERFVITSLGRMVPRKGHLVLAEALQRLPSDIAGAIDWLIIGPEIDEVYAARVREVTTDCLATTRFMGSLDFADVRATLGASDLFCLPGYIDHTGAVEGFGLVYLEAAAMGLTSIASDSGGVPDAVMDEETGILVPPGDAAAVAQAIEQLFADRARLADLSARALAHARNATWSKVAAETYAPKTGIPS